MRTHVLGLAVAAVLGACAAVPSNRALEQADYGSSPGGAANDHIRAAFRDLLLDAGSAEFRFGAPEHGWGRSDQGFVYGWVIWTDVNSKNQFGAFTGWQTYKVLTTNGDVHSIYRPDGNDLFGNPKFDRLR